MMKTTRVLHRVPNFWPRWVSHVWNAGQAESASGIPSRAVSSYKFLLCSYRNKMASTASSWPAPTLKTPLDAKTLEKGAAALFTLALALLILLITYWIYPTTSVSSFLTFWYCR